ncbi:sigma-54 dependent transcriptional regulator [Aurantivibrio plasticivorans]
MGLAIEKMEAAQPTSGFASANNEGKRAPLTIMIVEDDDNLREALSDTLELAKFNVVAASSAENALEKLSKSTHPAMIISDVNMGEMTGHDLLAVVKRDFPHIPMMLITAYASVGESVDAMRHGAVDYLVKPFEPQLLIDAVNRFVGDAVEFKQDAPVAQSASSKRLLELASRVAQSDSTVLIVGESGSGKEVLARYVHQQSPRHDKPFVAINCAAIPESMLEAILFGHEKGAYTGAHNSAPGKFEQANGGTLLLDEISEMDLGLQAKLLRVLQEREVERLGGRKTIPLDVRVIATSNRNLQQAVIDGSFREDLYYRLSVLPMQWLPLRDRPEDIVPLAERLLQQHARKQCRRDVTLTASAAQTLLSYSWPGNVRELDNVMQRALILQPGNTIHSNDLGLEGIVGTAPSTLGDIRPPIHSNSIQASSGLDAAVVEKNEDSMATESHSYSGVGSHSIALNHDLKRKEFELIVDAIRNAGGSRKLTAERLGISPRTLRYKIARLKDQGLDVNKSVKNLT